MPASPQKPASRAAGLDGVEAALAGGLHGVTGLGPVRGGRGPSGWGRGDGRVGGQAAPCRASPPWGAGDPRTRRLGHQSLRGEGPRANLGCLDGWGLGSGLPRVWGRVCLFGGPFLEICLKSPHGPALGDAAAVLGGLLHGSQCLGASVSCCPRKGSGCMAF